MLSHHILLLGYSEALITLRDIGERENLTSGRSSKFGPNRLTVNLQSSIISYMIRQALPTISAVNRSNFDEIISLDIAALIAYIDENDRKSSEVFTSIADSYRDQFVFGITSDLTLAKANVSELPFIILYNPSDQVNAVFDDAFDVDMIHQFISRVSTPLIGKFGLETYYAYTEVRDFRHKVSEATKIANYALIGWDPTCPSLRPNRRRMSISCRNAQAYCREI
jgi:Thioredoxin-like domain